MIQKYEITKIGFIFSLVGFCSMYTIVIPLLCILPAGFLESLFHLFWGDKPYKYIGISVIISLILLFLVSTYFFIKNNAHQSEGNRLNIISYFTLQWFIIPSFFFYLDTSSNWEKASDGQFFFGIFDSFPISCASFFFLGLFIDLYRNFGRKLVKK